MSIEDLPHSQTEFIDLPNTEEEPPTASTVVAQVKKAVVDVDIGYDNLIIPFVIAIVVILLTIVLFLKKKKAKTNVLILGLSDSGKTFIFSKLLCPDEEWECYKSMTENSAQIEDVNNKQLTLIDYPGHERLRFRLFERHLGKDKNQIKRVLFVIDSDTFTKKVRDIGDFMHDVLYAIGTETPFLVACNKQDLDTAKSSKAIKNILEKEIALVAKTRSNTLASTSDTILQHSIAPNGDFSWAKCAPQVEFADVAAVNNDSMSTISSWVTSA